MSIYENGENAEMMKMCKSQNDQNAKMHKMKMSLFTLRPENAIPYVRRGTPWKPQNAKNAGPGGSENTNCRKVPFI